MSSGFRKFTRRNFRYNLTKLTGGAPEGAHAHHVLPIEFNKYFRPAGINIHHPRYGAWWNAQAHLKSSKAYSDEFLIFFRDNRNPTRAEILDFARGVAREYNLNVFF